MPFSQSKAGVAALLTCACCSRLPAGEQMILLPAPGAGPYVCTRPCGGRCPYHSDVPAPEPNARLCGRLRLPEGLAILVAEIEQHCPVERPGTEETVLELALEMKQRAAKAKPGEPENAALLSGAKVGVN